LSEILRVAIAANIQTDSAREAIIRQLTQSVLIKDIEEKNKKERKKERKNRN